MGAFLSDPRAWFALLAVLLGGCVFALVSARCQRCRERRLLREAARVGTDAHEIAGEADSAIRQLGWLGVVAAAGPSRKELSEGIARLEGLQDRAARIAARCEALAEAAPGKPSYFVIEQLERLRMEAAQVARMRAELRREAAKVDTLMLGAWLHSAAERIGASPSVQGATRPQ